MASEVHERKLTWSFLDSISDDHLTAQVVRMTSKRCKSSEGHSTRRSWRNIQHESDT